MEVGHAAAVLGGALSFLSPCVLPLIIPYLGFLGGVTLRAAPGGVVAEVPARGRVLLAALFFVLGFATVFTALGATASAVSQLLQAHLETAALVAGAVLVLFGLHVMGVLRLGLLNREARFQTAARPLSPAGAYVVGLAFAFGWTPCIGPVLGAILSLAAQEGSVERGMLLMGFYAVGLGVPFLLVALFLRQAVGLLAGMRRHMRNVERAMGALLVAVGLMMLTGAFTDLSFWLLETFPALGLIG